MSAPEGWATWTKERQEAYLVKLGVKTDPFAPLAPGEHSALMAREAEQHRARIERERIETEGGKGIAP